MRPPESKTCFRMISRLSFGPASLMLVIESRCGGEWGGECQNLPILGIFRSRKIFENRFPQNRHRAFPQCFYASLGLGNAFSQDPATIFRFHKLRAHHKVEVWRRGWDGGGGQKFPLLEKSESKNHRKPIPKKSS